MAYAEGGSFGEVEGGADLAIVVAEWAVCGGDLEDGGREVHADVDAGEGGAVDDEALCAALDEEGKGSAAHAAGIDEGEELGDAIAGVADELEADDVMDAEGARHHPGGRRLAGFVAALFG